jgi:hypothetical protein
MRCLTRQSGLGNAWPATRWPQWCDPAPTGISTSSAAKGGGTSQRTGSVISSYVMRTDGLPAITLANSMEPWNGHSAKTKPRPRRHFGLFRETVT